MRGFIFPAPALRLTFKAEEAFAENRALNTKIIFSVPEIFIAHLHVMYVC